MFRNDPNEDKVIYEILDGISRLSNVFDARIIKLMFRNDPNEEKLIDADSFRVPDDDLVVQHPVLLLDEWCLVFVFGWDQPVKIEDTLVLFVWNG